MASLIFSYHIKSLQTLFSQWTVGVFSVRGWGWIRPLSWPLPETQITVNFTHTKLSNHQGEFLFVQVYVGWGGLHFLKLFWIIQDIPKKCDISKLYFSYETFWILLHFCIVNEIKFITHYVGIPKYCASRRISIFY